MDGFADLDECRNVPRWFQLAALKNKLSAQYANIATDEGMEQRANQQASAQSRAALLNDSDAAFASTIGLKPTNIAGVTDAAMLGVGGAGVVKTIAEQGLKPPPAR